MAEANAPKLGFTRRSFLKGVGGAAALSAAGVAGMTSAQAWLAPAQADAAQVAEEYTACTFHQAHCGGMCPLKCTVRDGRMVLVQPNEKGGAVCTATIGDNIDMLTSNQL